MKISGVLLDMDGLLVDTEKLYNRFWMESGQHFGYDFTYEDAMSIRSLTHVYASDLLKKRFDQNFPYEQVRDYRRKIMQDYIDENGVKAKKGALELLRYCSENHIRTCLATASPLRRAQRYLEPLGIWQYLEKAVCGDEVTIGKPAPDIYLAAAAKVGLSPQECLALEDSPNGIMAAHAAGCKPVMIPDMDEPTEEIRSMLFDCVEDLEKVIPILEKTT